MPLTYPAIINTTTLDITYPDFPHLTAKAPDLDNAPIVARTTLYGHVQKTKVALEPRKSFNVTGPNHLVQMVQIPSQILQQRKIPIQITMDPNLVARIDAHASNRSGCIAKAVEEYLNNVV